LPLVEAFAIEAAKARGDLVSADAAHALVEGAGDVIVALERVADTDTFDTAVIDRARVAVGTRHIRVACARCVGALCVRDVVIYRDVGDLWGCVEGVEEDIAL
jgi:hypothetical protein